MSETILSGLKLKEEELWEETLRPLNLEEFIGQEKIKKNLSVFIKAAKGRKQVLDHVLFSGPPGLGKTTLAFIIAREMGAPLKVISGPAVEKPGDLAAVLTNLDEKGILFIDEIHRLHPAIEEILYSAMEDFRLDIIVGQGPGAKTVKISLKPFTLIGATTRAGLITPPLYGRFGIILRMDYYDIESLKKIAERTARILNIKISEGASYEIGKRARGTPRVVNRLVKRIRDFVEVEGKNSIELEETLKALEVMDVDEFGLEEMDRRILQVVIENFNGGPVGIKSLASSIGEDKGTLEDLYEPFLVQSGFLIRTGRGRVATKKAYEHLGYKFDKTSQGNLFNE